MRDHVRRASGPRTGPHSGRRLEELYHRSSSRLPQCSQKPVSPTVEPLERSLHFGQSCSEVVEQTKVDRWSCPVLGTLVGDRWRDESSLTRSRFLESDDGRIGDIFHLLPSRLWPSVPRVYAPPGQSPRYCSCGPAIRGIRSDTLPMQM